MAKMWKIATVLFLAAAVGMGYYGYQKDLALKSMTDQNAKLQKTVSILKTKEKLETVVKDQQDKLDFYKSENDMASGVMNFGYDFAKSVISGNLDQIEPLLMDKLVVVKEENKIYIIKDGNLQKKILLYEESPDKVFKEMKMNAYSKLDEKTYAVQLIQFFTTKEGKPLTPSNFMHITLTVEKGKFKVTSVENNQ